MRATVFLVICGLSSLIVTTSIRLEDYIASIENLDNQVQDLLVKVEDMPCKDCGKRSKGIESMDFEDGVNITDTDESIEIGNCDYWTGINYCPAKGFRLIQAERKKGCRNDYRKWYYLCSRTVIERGSEACENEEFAEACKMSCNRCGKSNYITTRATRKAMKPRKNLLLERYVLYGKIMAEGLEEKIECESNDDVTFCASMHYKEQNAKLVQPSAVQFCASEIEQVDNGEFQPGERSCIGTTLHELDFKVDGRWNVWGHQFTAKCGNLELITVARPAVGHILNIDKVQLHAGSCDSLFKQYENNPV